MSRCFLHVDAGAETYPPHRAGRGDICKPAGECIRFLPRDARVASRRISTNLETTSSDRLRNIAGVKNYRQGHRAKGRGPDLLAMRRVRPFIGLTDLKRVGIRRKSDRALSPRMNRSPAKKRLELSDSLELFGHICGGEVGLLAELLERRNHIRGSVTLPRLVDQVRFLCRVVHALEIDLQIGGREVL